MYNVESLISRERKKEQLAKLERKDSKKKKRSEKYTAGKSGFEETHD
jgi:hypothetical protein